MKKIAAAFRIALASLRVNKMRSALTMLGIIIGVAAVITTVAVGTGANARIQQQIASMGSNLIVVTPGSLTTGGLRLGSGFALTLTSGDAQAIATECPSVGLVAPGVRGGVQVVFGNTNWATSVFGTKPNYLPIRAFQMAEGSAFTDQDIERSAKVALLGQTVVRNLFSGVDPVGQTVRLNHVPFTVAGILAPKGQSGMGQDQDDVILIPITTAQKRLLGASSAGVNAVNFIFVQARSTGDVAAAQDQIRTLLRQRHRLLPSEEDDFTLRNLQEILATQTASARIMSALLAAVASVALLVGGIGIMNIMLVSVTERTREIGLRLAVGAKTRDILLQFLTESAALALLGGVIGIALGGVISLAFSHFANWRMILGFGAIALSFVFSVAVGIGFGYYPARKAAFLDPIEALRRD